MDFIRVFLVSATLLLTQPFVGRGDILLPGGRQDGIMRIASGTVSSHREACENAWQKDTTALLSYQMFRLLFGAQLQAYERNPVQRNLDDLVAALEPAYPGLANYYALQPLLAKRLNPDAEKLEMHLLVENLATFLPPRLLEILNHESSGVEVLLKHGVLVGVQLSPHAFAKYREELGALLSPSVIRL